MSLTLSYMVVWLAICAIYFIAAVFMSLLYL
jgi:hypothetical protein